MAELKPCPFCCGNNLKICDWYVACWVECLGCFTEGPSAETPEEAIEVWNRRVEDGN